MSDLIDSQPEIPANASAIAPGTPDDHGTPFDPARHIPKKHPRTGRWMPRGGRKVKSSATTSTASELPLGDTSAALSSASSNAGNDAERSTKGAPDFSDIDAAAGPATKPAEGAAATPATAANGDAALPAEAAGEIGSRALYAITGAVIGNHKAATAGAAEHKNITAVLTAYAKHRGWAMVGALALIGTIVAYLLADGRREPLAEMIKKAFGQLKKKPPVNVTPESATIEIDPATPAPAPAAAPSAPAESFEKI